jgi:hypothetical protein
LGAARVGGSAKEDGRMKRKRNLYFGFGPDKTGKDRMTVYRKPKGSSRTRSSRKHRSSSRASGDSSLRSEVAEALVGQGYKRADARKMVGRAAGSDFGSLFRDSIKKNPRVLPEMNDEQLAAIRKLLRGKSIMAKKQKSKKKKSGRKGKMPAGLKAYWAKKRAAKAKRNPRRRRRTNPRARVRTRTVVKYRYRTRPRRKVARRRKSNPLRKAKRITLKGFTASQIRTVASVVRRATGKRVRVVKP